MIESVPGLTYEVASSLVDFDELIHNYSYKVVLFDKEYSDLDVSATVATIRTQSASHNLPSYIVLVDDSIQKESDAYINEVDEIINNVVTRDVLQSLFAKHAKEGK